MKGNHHIVIESARLKYEFDIRRNITIIQGDSATGKTTLIDLLSDFQSGDDESPVRIESDVPCEVFAGTENRWRQYLDMISDSIVFIDEGNHFMRSKEFADVVRGSSNYFVLITREALPELPYSIQEVYGIRTSGRYHFPEKIYHEFYRIYAAQPSQALNDSDRTAIITEDSGSGNQFFRSFCRDGERCISAGGNSQIYRAIKDQSEDKPLVVIADGAALGPFAARIIEYAGFRSNILLYFPESFEWIILKSGAIGSKSVDKILSHPEDHIESEQYMSWEQFFTELLESETKDDNVKQYHKSRLLPFYTSAPVKEKVLQIVPSELSRLLKDMERK